MDWTCLVCGAQYQFKVGTCLVCRWEGLVGPTYRPPRSEVLSRPQIATARDLAAMAFDHLPIPAEPELRIGCGALVLIGGPPSAGKSTLALQWLSSIESATCYLSAEEGLGPTLAGRLQRLGINKPSLTIVSGISVDDLGAVLTRTHSQALCVDSVNCSSLTPRDLRQLITQCELKALFAISQVNKHGEMAGRNELQHEADVIIKVEKGGWELTKSRYQQIGMRKEISA